MGTKINTQRECKRHGGMAMFKIKAYKIKTLSLLMCVLFALLCGCTSSGETYEKTPHISENMGEIPEHLVVVNSYNTIKHEIKNIVAEGEKEGKFAVVDYWGELDADIKSIIKEITTLDPIGSYAVSSIMYEQAKAVGFQQLSVSVEYKKTPLEIKSVKMTTDDSDFEQKLSDMFGNFETKGSFMLVTTKTDEELYEQVLKGYYLSADTAIGLKSLKVSPVRDTMYKQIIEIEIAYVWEKETLIKMSGEVENAVNKLCVQYKGSTHEEKMEFIANYLRTEVSLNAEAMRVVAETGNIQPKFAVYSAYGALIENDASQSGIALAAKMMCDTLGIESRFIMGEKDFVSHAWILVKNGEIWQHCDVTSAGERYIIPQGDIAEGYKYNVKLYPTE